MKNSVMHISVILLCICLLGGTIIYSMQQHRTLSPAQQTMYAWIQRNKPWLQYSSPGLALLSLGKSGIQKSSQTISNFYRTMWLRYNAQPTTSINLSR